MENFALNSSLNELSNDTLTVQIGYVEPLLALFLSVLSFYGEILDGHVFTTVLSLNLLQA